MPPNRRCDSDGDRCCPTSAQRAGGGEAAGTGATAPRVDMARGCTASRSAARAAAVALARSCRAPVPPTQPPNAGQEGCAALDE